MLLLLAATGCDLIGPNLDEEHARLTSLLDATVRDLDLEVEKVTDNPPIECTMLVGGLNTGEFRKSRMMQLKTGTFAETRELVERIAERWRAEGFDAKVDDFAERGIFVNAKDGEQNALSFIGYPNARFGHLSSQTACRKP